MDLNPVKILVVDDEEGIRQMLLAVLQKESFQVKTVENAQKALKLIKDEYFDFVISDVRLPDLNGVELLKRLKTLQPDLKIILITAYQCYSDAVAAMKAGAEDYLIKPFDIDELILRVKKALSINDLEKENLLLKERLEKISTFEGIVGATPGMQKIFELVKNIAPTDATVLICGESGTGKELIAQAIHRLSNRAGYRFVSINCGAMPENLLESELFGHVKGSFTDAYRDKEGLFETANGGTLFLDEIAEMSPLMQVKLLRALQEKKVRRVGSNREIDIDVRIIAATNQNLTENISAGKFRQDLYYRLNVININLPPLRERKSDIPLLVDYFIRIYCRKLEKKINGIEKEALSYLLDYHWPGNVRELENIIERAVTIEQGEMISAESISPEVIINLPDAIRDYDWKRVLARYDNDFEKMIADISRSVISAVFFENDGNLKKTANQLKLSYRSLRYLIDKYQLREK